MARRSGACSRLAFFEASSTLNVMEILAIFGAADKSRAGFLAGDVTALVLAGLCGLLDNS
jgi:hypothetical protein